MSFNFRCMMCGRKCRKVSDADYEFLFEHSDPYGEFTVIQCHRRRCRRKNFPFMASASPRPGSRRQKR